MAVQNPPWPIQAGSHAAELVRRSTEALAGGRGGIISPGDLAVAENGTPNMSVNVAAGRVLVPGSESAFQGHYFCESRATENRVIASADATNARKDLVIARVKDAAYSGAVNSWDIEVVTGTPAPSPSEPSLASFPNSWVLAMVDVPANDTAITNSQITDRRTQQAGQKGRAAALGGVIVCTSTNRPGHLDGLRIYETDTKRTLTSDGTNWNGSGEVDYKERLTDVGSITSGQDITGLASTFTPVTGRKYKVTLQADFLSDTAGDIGIAMITDGSNTILKEGRTGVLPNAGQQGTATAVYRSAALPAVIKGRMRRNAGASTGTVKASGTNPAILLIEDITGT